MFPWKMLLVTTPLTPTSKVISGLCELAMFVKLLSAMVTETGVRETKKMALGDRKPASLAGRGRMPGKHTRAA